MLFVFNIGNTHAQYTTIDNKKCGDIKCCDTSDFNAKLIPSGIPVAGASVVPAVTLKLSGLDIFWINSSIKSNIDFSMTDHPAVGADRIANVIRLGEITSRAAVCFDFGTAITMEVVDAKRRFRGGAIMPGRTLLRRSLNDYTAQLPLIDLFQSLPDNLGVNTVDAMRLGIDGGVIGSVRWLIKRAKENLPDQEIDFFGIGGDTDFFTWFIPELKSGGTDFTLQGIRRAWEINNES